MAGISLSELPIRKGMLLACIYRDGKMILPRGRDVLLAGDMIVVVTTISGLNDINDLFSQR